MNKFVKTTFDSISREAESYRNSVKSALLDYRQEMEKAKKEAGVYKDEAEYIKGKKNDARRTAQVAIQLAENAFTVAVGVEAKSLRDDLHQHLTTRPSPAFLDALRLYYDFNITPSRSEIEALMELNGGNTLGYRALNRTLEKTRAEYRVDAPDSTTYEADLAALDELAEGHIMFIPRELHHEGVEVFGGEPRPIRRADGSRVDTGYRWDSVSVLTASANYEGKVKALDEMADRWSSTVLPSMKHVSAYQDKKDPASGETITAAQQITEDFKATATAPEIKPSTTAAERIAEEIHKDTVESYERGQEILNKYIV